MNRALTVSERARLSPGGLAPRHGGGRNDPRGRASFDNWLTATRQEREGDSIEYLICESDGYHVATITGLNAAREYKDFLQGSVAHPYRALGERLTILPA